MGKIETMEGIKRNCFGFGNKRGPFRKDFGIVKVKRENRSWERGNQ